MAEPRHSPLDGLLPWSLDNGAVALAECRFLEQIGLRAKPPVPAYLAGVPLPLQPNRVAPMRELRTLWLGPDEWLVTAPEGLAPDLQGRLTRAIEGRHAAVVDLSASRIALEIAGPQARTLLEKGCGLDLHPRAFVAGCCAQTLFAKLPVIIDQLSTAPLYRLFVRRSAASWLAAWLIDAAQEFRFAE
ncbi:MAG TPA: sarcosine oxidase subunit gamma family protein [Stellaceae bacterium]|nr:sarcosine oxidase subunit gamma family protein [Stellaceae bacterium]